MVWFSILSAIVYILELKTENHNFSRIWAEIHIQRMDMPVVT